MSDDSVLKTYETETEEEKINGEVKEMQKRNDELQNEIVFKESIEAVNEIQSEVDVPQQTVAAFSNRGFNYEEELSRLNEALNKDDTGLSQHNEIPKKRNKITQVFNTNQNNLGGKDKEWNSMKNLLVLESNGYNWKELNIKLPYPIEDHGAQFLDNNLYIFGGKYYYEPLNWTYKLSKSLQWERMADMNQKRCATSNSSVILNNQIWVCGGHNGYEIPLKSVEMYDPLTNKWKYMKSMNRYRSRAAAAVINGKIFCADYGSTGSVECYDPSSDVWTIICNMPQETYGHGIVEMNGHFIVIGGHNSRECFKNVWALDITDKNAVWISKPSMSVPRSNFKIAKMDEKIFVFGGCDISDSVEIFDGEVWRNGPKITIPRIDSTTFVISMEFANTLVENSIVAAEGLNVHSNNESLAKIPFNKSIEQSLGGEEWGKANSSSLLMLGNNGEKWKELSIQLPYAIRGHGAQFLNNNLYIFGGQNATGKAINWTYNLSKSLKWKKMADMNQGRKWISNSSVILNNQIWVCGGSNSYAAYLKTVEMYDPLTNKWKYMNRSRAAAAVVNGKIFCSDCGYSSVECYDPSSDVWTDICAIPNSIYVQSAVEMNGYFIIIGRINDEYLKNVWALDKNSVWIEKPSMSIPRKEFIIAKIDDKTFVCGGISAGWAMSDVEIFDGEVWRNGPKMPMYLLNAPAVVIPMEFAEELEKFTDAPTELESIKEETMEGKSAKCSIQ